MFAKNKIRKFCQKQNKRKSASIQNLILYLYNQDKVFKYACYTIYLHFVHTNKFYTAMFIWLQNLVDQLCNSLILILFKLRKSMMSNLEIIHGSHTCIVGVNMDWQDSNILFLVINVIISCQPMLIPTTHYGFHELSRIWYV